MLFYAHQGESILIDSDAEMALSPLMTHLEILRAQECWTP